MTAEIFCRILKEACGIAPGAHVLAAVSGGADSVALLCLLHEAQSCMEIFVSCAHVEHGIRGRESVDDMEFVRALCKQRNIPFYETRVDAPALAAQEGCGMEAAARTLRYDALRKTREAVGADVIATAHHSGDQAETVLMHAARGSDLRGLCAMRMASGDVIRPLLKTSPEKLRAYLGAIGQGWREDATNDDVDYARNAVRHLVLPQLRRSYPGAEDALARLALSAQRDEDFFAQQIAALDLKLIPLADGAAVTIDSIKDLHDALLSRVLVRLVTAADAQVSGTVIDRMIRMIRRGDTSSAVGVGSVCGKRAEVRFGERFLCVTKPQSELGEYPLRMDGETITPFGTFSVRRALAGETGDGVRCQTVKRPQLEGAVITARREGDSIIPFGRHTPVKVKKLLIDAGVERAMRRSVPVLRSAGEILWLPGIRTAEGCRAKENEERLMITFSGPECVKIQ